MPANTLDHQPDTLLKIDRLSVVHPELQPEKPTVLNIVLKLLFYGLLTPLARLMRLFKLDSLRLKPNPNASTYWVQRAKTSSSPLKHPF